MRILVGLALISIIIASFGVARHFLQVLPAIRSESASQTKVKADFESAKTCRADGQKFLDDELYPQFRDPLLHQMWDDPQFHFSRKRNTCLVASNDDANTYCLIAPSPPVRQDLQMPKVLPLPTMFVQRFVRLASSSRLMRLPLNDVSVTLLRVVAPVGAVWMVVPHPRTPGAKGNAGEPASAALLVHAAPLKAGPAPVLTSLTTTELGRIPVSVLLTKSLLIERETSAFGVTRHEQHEINCSSGESA